MHNEGVCLSSHRIRLVPYLQHHVPRYHRWMSNPMLLQTTCSEPLTLEEEYENQISWLASSDKLTFILLAATKAARDENELCSPEGQWERSSRNVPPLLDLSYVSPVVAALELPSNNASFCAAPSPMVLSRGVDSGEDKGLGDVAPTRVVVIPKPVLVSCCATSTTTPTAAYTAIGDCNLFLGAPCEREDGTAEIEVMVAEEAFRGRGLATEAIQLLMCYAFEKVNIRRFVAKILSTNAASIHLFRDKLQFLPFKEVCVFGETHFERVVDERYVSACKEDCGYALCEYTREKCEANVVPICVVLQSMDVSAM